MTTKRDEELGERVLHCDQCGAEMEAERWENGLYLNCPECPREQIP